MTNILMLIPQVIVLVIVFIFQWLEDELTLQNLGLYLHVDGVSLMIPLTSVREDIMQEMTVILVSCTMMILITSAAYSGAKNESGSRGKKHGMLALFVGTGVFLLGLILNLIF